MEGGLGGALRRQGRRSSPGRLFRAYPPWAASYVRTELSAESALRTRQLFSQPACFAGPKIKYKRRKKNPIGENLRVSVRFVYQVSSDSTRCQESESLINLKKNRRPSAHHRGRIRAAGSTPAARTLTDPRAHRVPRTALAPARCRSYDYLTTSTQRTETHLDKNHKNPPVDLLRYTYPLSRSSS